jgi:uncharacterized protein DUF3592
MELFLLFTLAVLGFIPVGIVLWKRFRIKQLKQTGVLVTGVVEDVIVRQGYKGSRYCQAIIQYYVPGWGTLRGSFIFGYSRRHPLYARMQSVEIYYDKNKPARFTLRKGDTYTAALIFTAIFATAILVLCYFVADFIINPA